MNATIDGKPLSLTYTRMQEAIFLKTTQKYVIAACGRRSGKTHGAAQFMVETLLGVHDKKCIWVDVQYNQVVGYVETYFLPILHKLNPVLWNWQISRRELTILDNTISFRSSDRPDLLVGRGYWLAIMNEAGISLYKQPALWTQYVSPMLLDYKDSRCFFIGTPRGIVGRDGKDNVYYKMFLKGQSGSSEYNPDYVSFKYSSYDNHLLSAEDIKKLEEETPPRIRLQELYGEFVSLSESCIFDPEWWTIVDDLPSEPNFFKRFISIDSAFSEKESNDESAMTVWIKTFGGDFICIDCWHDHASYPDLVTKAKEMIDLHNPDCVVVENKASGQSLIQTLRRDLGTSVIAWPPEGVRMPDKVNRAASITTYLEQGKVKLLKSWWNKDLVNQCTVFPDGDRDDIVDTISQALWYGRMTETKLNPFITHKIIDKPIGGQGRPNLNDAMVGYGPGSQMSLGDQMRGYSR